MANWVVCDRCGCRINSGENHRLTLFRTGYYILDFDYGPRSSVYDICPKCRKKIEEFIKRDGPDSGGVDNEH